MEEMQQHQGEWFFLHELNVDKVFSTIQRADYLILYYIKVAQEEHPGEKLYLADLAAAMGLRVTELSKGIEKLQDSGFVTWKTDREAGRTYVELSSKAVELMAEEQALLQRCYRRMRAELGDEELRRAAKADLPARIERLSQLTGLKYAKLTIRASRTKWGSCSGRNTISLSLFLMTLPEHLRDYVIVHELCHTVHHNHSPRFHALVDRMVGGNEKALNRELRAFAIR